MRDQTSVYFDACQLAFNVLGETAPKYFTRIQQLSQTNTLEELQAIINSWSNGLKPQVRVIADGLWKPGSMWGSSMRVEHESGIFWKLKCACGKFYSTSTNDTVAEHLRKCPECVLADLIARDPATVARLQETAALVRDWFDAYDKLIWAEVHATCRRRKIANEDMRRELHALCWARISKNAVKYKDMGFKPSAWLVRVAHNAMVNFFDTEINYRPKLKPLKENFEKYGIPNPNATAPEERLPARRTVSPGASPRDDAQNKKSRAWDARQDMWGTL